MERRFQRINGDEVIVITDSMQVQTRISKNRLVERRERLLAMIEHHEEELAGIDGQLAEIQNESEKHK